MKYLVVLSLFCILLGCQNQALDQALSPTVEVSADYGLTNASLRINEFCIDQRNGDFFLPIVFLQNNPRYIEMTNGDRFEQTIGRSGLVLKFDSGLNYTSSRFFQSQNDESRLAFSGCRVGEERVYIFGPKEGEYNEFKEGYYPILIDTNKKLSNYSYKAFDVSEANVGGSVINFSPLTKDIGSITISTDQGSVIGQAVNRYQGVQMFLSGKYNRVNEKLSNVKSYMAPDGIYSSGAEEFFLSPTRSVRAIHTDSTFFYLNNKKIVLNPISDRNSRSSYIFMEEKESVKWMIPLHKKDSEGSTSPVRFALRNGRDFIYLIEGGSFEINGVSFMTAGSRDAYLISINENGVINWVKQFGTNGNDISIEKALAADEKGNLYYAFTIQGDIVYPEELSHVSLDTGTRNIVLVKLSSGGDVLGHVSIRTNTIIRSPVLNYYDGKLYLVAAFDDYLKIDNTDIDLDFNSERRLYVLRIEM